MKSHLLLTLVLACLAIWPQSAVAEVRGPYQPDTYTLHLYHFDEETEDAKDSANGDPRYSLRRKQGAAFTAEAYPSFGRALDTDAKPASRAIAEQPLASKTYWNHQTGAFTIEAVVLMKFNPDEFSEQVRNRMQIISLDSDGTAHSRAFQLSFRAIGVLGATAPSLELVKFSGPEGGPPQTIVAALPQTGLHVPVRDQWFHLALSYSGDAGAPGNLKFYWTRVAPGITQANLIEIGSINRTPANQKALTLAIGNGARKRDGYLENWHGLIDEVRISSMARAADDFLFKLPPGQDQGLRRLPMATSVQFGSFYPSTILQQEEWSSNRSVFSPF